VLPHVVAFNSKAAPEAMTEIAYALGATNAAKGIFDLARKIGTPASLEELGMPLEGLEDAVDAALFQPYWNPRPLDWGGIRTLLDDAWHGRPPRDSTL
jgi:maleylacetate reductase